MVTPMGEYSKQLPTRVQDFERLPVERLLVILGGFAGIGLGLLAFALDAASGPFVGRLGGLTGVAGAVMTLVVTLLFSVLLIYAYVTMGRSEAQGAALAIAFSLVLFFFGGIAGAIAGILGVTGAVIVILRNVQWTSH